MKASSAIFDVVGDRGEGKAADTNFKRFDRRAPGATMTRRAHSLALLLAALCLASAHAQPSNDRKLADLMARLDEYMRTYETELTSITADERYEQRQSMPGYQRGTGGSFRMKSRILYSEMAFVRLPGDGEWTGYRDVRKVDGKAVGEGGMRLAALLGKGSGVSEQAAAITAASSKFNLGTERTINMPTVPLEILHPRHRANFTYRRAGGDVVRGVDAAKIDFKETGSPTVIHHPAGGDVPSTGSAWIDPKTGRLLRALVIWQGGRTSTPTNRDPRVMVDFVMDRRLKTMVPIEMREVFFVEDGRGEAQAAYSNFKRFETGAQLVPQP